MLYRSKATIEAILWTGWTQDPWPDDWVAFFGRSPFSHVKGEYNDVTDTWKTFLNVNGTWKELYTGYYATRTGTADTYKYAMQSPGVFTPNWGAT